MPPRLLSRTYQLDANRINARQADRLVNQLEKWNDDGVIVLEISPTAAAEAAYSVTAKMKAEKEYVSIDTPDVFGGEDEIRAQMAVVVFPNGITTANQKNDIRALFTARQSSATLITEDGASKTQPGGILGNAAALARLGVRVLSTRRAFDEIAAAIEERDRTARRICDLRGDALPSWVGQDHVTT
jgi:hypothetical protein